MKEGGEERKTVWEEEELTAEMGVMKAARGLCG